jgi:hypothetical protein
LIDHSGSEAYFDTLVDLLSERSVKYPASGKKIFIVFVSILRRLHSNQLVSCEN